MHDVVAGDARLSGGVCAAWRSADRLPRRLLFHLRVPPPPFADTPSFVSFDFDLGCVGMCICSGAALDGNGNVIGYGCALASIPARSLTEFSKKKKIQSKS